MNFLEPARLWLLLVIPLLIAGYVLLQYRKSHYAVRFTNMALLDNVVPRRVNWRQHVAVGLAMLTLAFGIVLFAQPSKVVKVPRETGVTVVLTMDISLSMDAEDVAPNRITAAKDTARSSSASCLRRSRSRWSLSPATPRSSWLRRSTAPR